MPQEEIKKSVCMWCKGECGVLVKVRKGHLVDYESNPDYPRKIFPPASACVRRKYAKEYVYHPERVRFPLKRVGERGEGRWKRISWEQALDEVAGKLDEMRSRYGPEALAVTFGTYRTHWEYKWRFCHVFGTPNITGGLNVCSGPRQSMAHAIVGNFPFYSISPNTKCIVLLGFEPNPARPRTLNSIRTAKRNGAKLIVIDPRRTKSASEADIWLQLRPGTDCALLLGMIHVVINENLYDEDFVENWCHGFDKLKEYIKEYPPEKAAKTTGIPATKIKQAARMYAKNRPGAFGEGMGIEEARANGEIIHARWILAAICGNIDVEGGEEFSPHNPPEVVSNRETELWEALSPEQRRKQIGGDSFKLFSWEATERLQKEMLRVWGKSSAMAFCFAHPPSVVRAIISGDPYPIKSLIICDNNPLITWPNSKLVYKALKSPNLDLIVTMDLFMTPSAELSDYFFPMTCWLERPALILPHSDQDFLTVAERALPALIKGEYEYKTEYDVCRELSIRLGLGEYWPRGTLEGEYDFRLKSWGYTLHELAEKGQYYIPSRQYKKYEQKGFGTSTGKVELYSTTLEMLGYDPLPHYKEPYETPVSCPELTKEYPLSLISGGRVRPFYHSEWRQVESVRKLRPDPILQIHPKTATPLHIKEGDWVWVEGVRGKIRMKAEFFYGIDPKVVHAEHGWWFPELPGEDPWLHGAWESNVNVLTGDDPEYCNPITGAWGLKTALCNVVPCKVYKAKKY